MLLLLGMRLPQKRDADEVQFLRFSVERHALTDSSGIFADFQVLFFAA